MNVANHYTYRVRWSVEDESYVGTVAELPSLSWVADDRAEAFAGIQQLAADVVEDIAAFDAAMAEEGPNIPWEQVKADLGWT